MEAMMQSVACGGIMDKGTGRKGGQNYTMMHAL